MDAKTKKGRQFIEAAGWGLAQVLQVIAPNHFIIETDQNSPALLDGGIIEIIDQIGGPPKAILRGLFEVKARNASLEQMQEWGSWLITAEKIEQGREIAAALRVPLYGFCYLMKSELTLCWQITTPAGAWTYPFEKHRQRTRKTVNGGRANRLNIYLPVSEAMIAGKDHPDITPFTLL